jgi:hypothetical protein
MTIYVFYYVYPFVFAVINKDIPSSFPFEDAVYVNFDYNSVLASHVFKVPNDVSTRSFFGR